MQSGIRRCATLGLGLALPQPDEKFLIVCLPRTGSELLVELLDSQPALRCEGEILHEPVRLPERFLCGRAALAARKGARAWGAKIIFHQLDWYSARYGPPNDVLRRWHDSGFRVISLSRRDLLEQAISALQAIDGRYHYQRGEFGRPETLRVGPEAVVAMLWSLEEQERRRVDALDGIPDAFDLTYEVDLLEPMRQQRSVERICHWLGVPSTVAASKVERRTARSLADRVEDFPALARTLATTRYRSLLETAERAHMQSA